MSPFFQNPIECASCHRRNEFGSKYCGGCGQPLPETQVKCSSCGTLVDATASFCGSCGKPLADTAAPQITKGRWSRSTDDFASKVDVSVEELRAGLVIEA